MGWGDVDRGRHSNHSQNRTAVIADTAVGPTVTKRLTANYGNRYG